MSSRILEIDIKLILDDHLFPLSQLFFEHFDTVQDIEAFATFLQTQFQRYANRPLSQSMARLAQHALHLFALTGPAWVVQWARQRGLPLEAAAESLGLSMERPGRFFTQCKNMYYVRTLQELQLGQAHDVLHEVVRAHVYESAYENGWLLGHKVIQILVDKAAGAMEMPDNWLQIILTIAGDPRVSKRTAHYLRWWSLLGESYVKRVRQWLSKMDLKLFLAILEDYAERSDNREIQRMFPARQRFLNGIFARGLIRHSRLFLSREAERYIKQYYQKNEILSYSRVNDRSRSVIYLNIDGKHVLEGTHNFYFWIYQQLPLKNLLEDYDFNEVNIRELGVGLQENYKAQFGVDDITRITHAEDWQHKVLMALRQLGTLVDPADVLSKADYRVYRRKHGIEV